MERARGQVANILLPADRKARARLLARLRIGADYVEPWYDARSRRRWANWQHPSLDCLVAEGEPCPRGKVRGNAVIDLATGGVLAEFASSEPPAA